MSLPVLDTAPVLGTGATLWLVRHGESTWNIAGLAQGHNDEAELTDQMTWRPVDNATIVRIPEFGTLSRGGIR
jgi:hypothetical protein